MLGKLGALAGLLAGLLAGSMAAPAAAQTSDYPNRPITIVVPYGPGGTASVFAQLYADRLQKKLKQPVLVENRPGATALIGTRTVIEAKPDGYTLISGVMGALAPLFFSDAPFDVLEELSPVAQTHMGSTVIFANPGVPADLRELVAFAKSNPDKVRYGFAATTTMLPIELLKSLGGLTMIGVPYKGGAAVTTALLSNEVQIAIDGVITYKPHIDAGSLKAVAVLGKERIPLLPDTPTATEMGFPDMVVPYNSGIWAPKGTPDDIVAILNAAVNEATQDPEIQDRINALGAFPVTEDPTYLLDSTRAEVATHRKAAEVSGWKPAN